MPRSPFKLKDVVDAVGTLERANVARASDGKFRSLEQQTPHEIRTLAEDQGKLADDVVSEQRVPDRLVGESGQSTEVPGVRQRTYAQALPWPEAGPVNDAGRSPMKLQD
jgi:hypothetical protein